MPHRQTSACNAVMWFFFCSYHTECVFFFPFMTFLRMAWTDLLDLACLQWVAVPRKPEVATVLLVWGWLCLCLCVSGRPGACLYCGLCAVCDVCPAFWGAVARCGRVCWSVAGCSERVMLLMFFFSIIFFFLSMIVPKCLLHFGWLDIIVGILTYLFHVALCAKFFESLIKLDL